MSNKKHLLVVAQDCYKTFDKGTLVYRLGMNEIQVVRISERAFLMSVQEIGEKAIKIIDDALLSGITHIVCHCDFALALQIYQYASCAVPIETDNFVTRMLDNNGSFFMSANEDKPKVVLPIKCVQASIDQSGNIELFEVM